VNISHRIICVLRPRVQKQARGDRALRRQRDRFLARMELVPLVRCLMPDATRYPHPQDVANLILYLQTELALFEQWAAQEGIPSAALRPIERSQEALRRAVDQLELREWYRELTYGFRDQLGRLEEWL